MHTIIFIIALIISFVLIYELLYESLYILHNNKQPDINTILGLIFTCIVLGIFYYLTK